MNAKKAKQLRRMTGCDLGKNTDCKQNGVQTTGSKLIGQIHHDGTLTEREQEVIEARTTEERYLYRQLKQIYGRSKVEPFIRKTLLKDLAELTAKTNGGEND